MTGSRGFFGLCLLVTLAFMGLVARGAFHSQAMPPAAAAGWEIWQERGCEGCHTLYGIGGNYGPDLTLVAEQGEDSLRALFANPLHSDHWAIPRFNLTSDEVTNVIALLSHADQASVGIGWPPDPIRVSGTGGS